MTFRSAGHGLEEDVIVSDFRGFRSRDTLFKFRNGHVYQQNEHLYVYYYAYRPTARVVDGPKGAGFTSKACPKAYRLSASDRLFFSRLLNRLMNTLAKSIAT